MNFLDTILNLKDVIADFIVDFLTNKYGDFGVPIFAFIVILLTLTVLVNHFMHRYKKSDKEGKKEIENYLKQELKIVGKYLCFGIFLFVVFVLIIFSTVYFTKVWY